MLEVVGIPEATYQYHIKQFKKEDPDKEWKESFKNCLKNIMDDTDTVVFIQIYGVTTF